MGIPVGKYGTAHLVFNDDIQGTASVVLAGLIASLKLLGGSFADHTFLFLGAGEAGTGIAELIALEISNKTQALVEETRKKIWLVDSKGLIVSDRKETLQLFKKPWAHEHVHVSSLLDAVKWFYSGGDQCGLVNFPTFGLKAWKQFMTYVGAGMICSHLVNLSLLLGAVLSWGIMWPLIRERKGAWFPGTLLESSMRSLNSYKVWMVHIGLSILLLQQRE